MFETLDLEPLCEQCDMDPCECEDWVLKNDSYAIDSEKILLNSCLTFKLHQNLRAPL